MIIRIVGNVGLSIESEDDMPLKQTPQQSQQPHGEQGAQAGGSKQFNLDKLKQLIQDLNAAEPQLAAILLDILDNFQSPQRGQVSPRIKACCPNEELAEAIHAQAHAMAALLRLACEEAPEGDQGATQAQGQAT